MSMTRLIKLPHKHRGAALVVSLIVLMILTLIGVASMQSTALEERMAGNIRDLNIALQTTESALREAEGVIEGLADTSGFGAGGGLYTLNNAPDPFSGGTWAGTASLTATTGVGGAVAPRYFIELIGDFAPDDGTEVNIFNYGEASGADVTVFRIVARGTGGTGTAQVILETFYGRRF